MIEEKKAQLIKGTDSSGDISGILKIKFFKIFAGKIPKNPKITLTKNTMQIQPSELNLSFSLYAIKKDIIVLNEIKMAMDIAN